MTIELTGAHHLRVPVGDLEVARGFWCDVLGYEWDFDFGDDGVGLRHAHGGPNVVLWHAPEVASATEGFTLFGIGVPDRIALEKVRELLDARGVAHAGIQPAFVEAKLPGVRTPDGALVGFYVKPGAEVAPATG